MALTPLAELLKKGTRWLSYGVNPNLLTIQGAWPHIIEKLSLTTSAAPKKIMRGVLMVECGSSAEAAYLEMHKKKILEELNKHLSQESEMSDIRWGGDRKQYGRTQ